MESQYLRRLFGIAYRMLGSADEVTTVDDPGEDTLEEDHFHSQTDNTTASHLEKDKRN